MAQTTGGVVRRGGGGGRTLQREPAQCGSFLCGEGNDGLGVHTQHFANWAPRCDKISQHTEWQVFLPGGADMVWAGPEHAGERWAAGESLQALPLLGAGEAGEAWRDDSDCPFTCAAGTNGSYSDWEKEEKRSSAYHSW